MRYTRVLLALLSCSAVWAAVRGVAFTADGKNLIAGYEDGRVVVWAVDEGRMAARWEGHKDGVYSVAVIPGGKLVATGSGDGTIGLWSWPEGRRVATLQAHGEAVLALAATPDGKVLVSGSGDATIKLWSLPEGWLLRTLEGHQDAVLSVAVSPDGKTLASGSADAEIGVWSLPEGKLLGQMKRGKIKTLKKGILSATSAAGNATPIGVRALAFSPGSDELYSSGLDIKRAPGEPARGAVYTWSVEDRSMRRVFKEHLTMVTSLAVSADGETLVSGSSDRTAKVCRLPDCDSPATLPLKGTVYSVAVSPDGQTVATADGTDAVELWDASGKTPRSTLRDPAAKEAGGLWWVQSQQPKTYLKFGYVDRAGVYRIEPQFDKAEEFAEGLALVRTRGRWFYIDPSGKEAVVPDKELKELGPFEGGLARAKKGKLAGQIDKSGKFVTGARPQPAAELREGLAPMRQGKLWGYADRTGRFAIEPRFSLAREFYDGCAVVAEKGAPDWEWGFINRAGKLIDAPWYGSPGDFHGGLARVAAKYSRMESHDGVLIDRTGVIVLDPRAEATRP